MTISITANTLCDLCKGHFTYEGAEALCNFCEEMGVNGATLGDLTISFAEVPTDWEQEIDDESIIARLSNGNILISQ